MVKREKTDNSHLESKLELRRYFLHKYHTADKANVFDCCQGSGKLWERLRDEFDVDYWGVDLKPQKGRLKLDSVRFLATEGWNHNVIDIDTYGSPWKHWFAMLPNVQRSTTVFLTYGHLTIGGGAADGMLLDAMGIKFRNLTVPNSLGAKLCEKGIDFCLACASRYGLELIEIIEALPCGNAQYFGIRLERPSSIIGKVETVHEQNADHLDGGHMEPHVGV